MKTLIALFLGLMISGLIYSQDYYPIVQENNEWNVLKVFPTPGNPSDSSHLTMTYKFYGDTIISNQVYKKVFKSEAEIPVNWGYVGGIREEEQKVWYLSKYESEETQLYDFTVEVGDTFATPGWESMVVDSITYIEINGEDRKQIYFSTWGYFIEHWIEGIGSSFGILQSGSGLVVGWYTRFLCMSEDGELIYMNPIYSSCYLVSTGIEEIHYTRILVYPNPARDKIIIKNRDNVKIESISIIDLNGRVLLKFENDINELDLSGFSKGIYLLKLTYGNEIIIKKIVIE
jgi:hypothetical protein